MRKQLKVRSEELAYWYFRLNGCLTIPNFVVHPDEGRDQRTDVDVIAVRFPHRAELLRSPMQDDQVLTVDKHRIRIILAEVKMSRCNLNGPWTDPKRGNMQRVVRAIGAVPQDMTAGVATGLYETGTYIDSLYNLSLFCISFKTNEAITEQFPAVTQLTWDRLVEFIFNRFRRYRSQKVAHPQWDDTGKLLWDCAIRSNNLDGFRSSVQIVA